MRKNYLALFAIMFVLVFIISINIASTARALECITLDVAKTYYLPKETVQVEINTEITRDILTSDISFYRGTSKLPINFFISKITDTKYFLWFDLPTASGNYVLKIKGICKQDNKWFIANAPIEIKQTIASHYDSLKPIIENNWLSLSLEEHILSAGALSHIFAEEALTTYSQRSDSCINTQCETKMNALTLITFEDGLVRQQMQNSLETSQNETGCWNNNENECDTENTAFALLSLAMTGRLNMTNNNDSGILWLKENATNIKEKSILYYLTKDPSILNEILNSRSFNGWWSKDIQNYEADIETTSLAVFALKNSGQTNTPVLEAIEKAENWLLNQEGLSLKEETFIFVFAFQNKNIEPLLAFWPGLVKTESQGFFNFILLNKGPTDMIINSILLNSTTTTNLEIDNIKNLRFDIPKITTTDGRTLSENLVLSYKSKNSQENYFYSIPVLIFTEQSDEEGIYGGVGSSEEEINESEQEEIINDTTNEWENTTTELNQSLIQKRFYFVEKTLNITKNLTDGRFTISIRLENKLDEDVKDISLTYSSSLSGFVEKIEPSKIEKLIQRNQETIIISILPIITKTYEGEIIATGTYKGEEITTRIPIIIKISGTAEEKTCMELGGKICEDNEICDEEEGIITSAKDTFSCCIPGVACKPKSNKGKLIGVIIVIVIIIILMTIFWLLKRKPKKEMKKFLEESAKQYEKKFQRPPSIRR